MRKSRQHRRALVAALLLTLTACSDAAGPSGPDTRPVASIAVTPAVGQLAVGDVVTVTAVLRDAGGALLTGRAVTWSSSDTAVATVAASGRVTAVAPGTVWVRAASEGRRDSTTVTVRPEPLPPPGAVASVTLDAATATLDEGATRQMVATPHDAQGRPIAGLFVGWTSSDPSVAQVDAVGRVTAVRTGTTTLTARVHGREATAAITVSASYAYDLLYSGQSTTRDVYRLDVRQPGAAPAGLFGNTASASQARPSPDGTRLVFVAPSPVDGAAALWVANRDGSARTLIVDEAGATFSAPTWSPDGQRIAYVRTHPESTPPAVTSRRHVWMANADGSGRVALTADLAGSQLTPAWSPRLADGTERIAFAYDLHGTGSQLRIWSMRPDGSDKRAVTVAADALDLQPAWSPDGQVLAFQRTAAGVNADLWVVDAAGGAGRPLTGPLAGAQATPAWSPDGRLIAFASSHESTDAVQTTYQIYTVWADGSKLARRTSSAETKSFPGWIARP